MNRDTIIATYERIEDADGGITQADLLRVQEKTLAELRVIDPGFTMQELRDVLAAHWAGMQG